MSRELILIPKLRYEQLVKQEQADKNAGPEKTVALSPRKQLSENDKNRESKQDPSEGKQENAIVNQCTEQLKSETMEDVHQPQIQRTSESEAINSNKGKKIKTKLTKNRKNQHGGSKPYISMTPKKMMNLQKKRENLHSKMKWLSFHI